MGNDIFATNEGVCPTSTSVGAALLSCLYSLLLCKSVLSNVACFIMDLKKKRLCSLE